jgi:hypothetical protein
VRVRRRRPLWLVLVVTGVAFCFTLVVAMASAPPSRPGTRPLLLGGIVPDATAPGGVAEVPPAAGPRAFTDAERVWLAHGSVPGATEPERDMACRALVDLRLLTSAEGNVAAAWHGIWKYVWPRDAAWVAAAFTSTGHGDDAARVLRRLAALQLPDGTWEARYRLDGAPVDDGRDAQLDANGWMPWATWFWYVQQRPDDPAVRDTLAVLWPAVRAAADHVADSLGRDGLPPRSADYWETRDDQKTVGTAAPLLAGLRAAADLARRTGAAPEATRWARAAERLNTAVHERFGRFGYPDPFGRVRRRRGRHLAGPAVRAARRPRRPGGTRVGRGADAAERRDPAGRGLGR